MYNILKKIKNFFLGKNRKNRIYELHIRGDNVDGYILSVKCDRFLLLKAGIENTYVFDDLNLATKKLCQIQKELDSRILYNLGNESNMKIE